MKTTLQDIALLSGVSKTTVSYVLNNRQTAMGISPQTIARVRSVIDEVNYKPNKAAVSLASQRKRKSRAIIVTPWLSSANSHFMTELARSFEEVQKVLTVEYMIYNKDNLQKTLSNFKRLGAYDAMLIIGTSEKDNLFLNTLDSELRKNIILLNRDVNGYTSVCTDDYAGGRLIASCVLKKKAYKKHVLVVPRKISQTVGKRLEGISSVFKELNIKLDIFKCKEWNEKDFEDFTAKYGSDKTMIFTFQDIMAVRLISYLCEQGINVPEQIGVTGYDAIEMSRYVTPSLTTVDAKNYEISKKAVELLLKKRFSGSTHLIKPKLIKRNSLILK
jgi:LacI family transcriptional regulator, galactose operon repressor